ncbi:MAG: carboxypeptidase M32 [Eubacteriales bacterium]|nr:carboxypeptidase M32 [Eubacteriales bacterium]
MKDTIAAFKKHLSKLGAYEHAMSKLYNDSVTVMPPKGSEVVGNAMGVLSEEEYKLATSSELRDMIETILAHKDEVDLITLREAEEKHEELCKLEKIPMDEYVQHQIDVNAASAAWHEAKATNDFELFRPHLEKMVAFNRKMAHYYAPDKPAYDTLLNEYEKGLTMETLDKFFADVRKKVVPLLNDIVARGRRIDTDFLDKEYPVDKQRILTDRLMKIMCMDPQRSCIGETEHPYTINFTKNDVRIMTHYHSDMLLSSFYSVVHEAGHATYELNIGDELTDSFLGSGVSMGVHESQSRLYENIIGRSEEFMSVVYDDLKELFPEQLKDVTREQLFLAANKVEPSLIRTEADELTYPLHIMVRYELEKQLISGTLEVKDLPKAWNEMMKEYLGVDVPSDTEGVLQDSHWSGGMFGYFPSYAIGSAYGAQMIAAMKQDFDVMEQVKSGELQPIIDWLTERIYRFGCIKKPKELVENACKAEFDPKYYTDYLSEKFTKIYQL